MKNILSCFFVICIIVLSSSCDKKGYDRNYDFEDFDKNICVIVDENEFVINDEDAYRKIIDTAYCTVNSIDFTKYTLIGKVTDGTGCEVVFEKKLFKNSEIKDFLYEIKVKEKGLCKKAYISFNWILVPKIPQDYTVTFKVN